MLKLQPNPTFKAKVAIDIAGQTKPAEVEIEFKWIKLAEWEGMVGDAVIRDLLVNEIVVGWSGIDASFSKEALGELFSAYPTSAMSIWNVFMAELFGAKTKN